MSAEEQIVPNTPQWLEERRKYMGASDAAPALGMSRWRKPWDVAREKKGLLPPQDMNDAMWRGHMLEPVGVELYRRRMDCQIGAPAFVVSEQHQFMAASLDATLPHFTDNRHLEIKTHSSWSIQDYGEEMSDEVSDYEYVQCQHQMAVTGHEYVDVGILFGDEQALFLLAKMLDGGVELEQAADLAEELMEFKIFRVYANKEFIDKLVAAEHEFWRLYVEGDEIPPDIATMQPRDDIIAADEELNAKIASFQTVWLMREEAQKQYDAMVADIKDIIGENAGISSENGKITWKKNKDTVKSVVDYKAMAEAICRKHGESFGQWEGAYTDERVVRRGARVFRVPAAWKKAAK